MVIFIGQLSTLKVYDGFLYLDALNQSVNKEILIKYITPETRSAKINRVDEFMEMASLSNIILPSFGILTSNPSDEEFIEGNRKREEHFRIERSVLLRKYYMKRNPMPICAACGLNTKKRYPWAEYLLEIHHLLPLSSSLAISSKGTSLEDIVGLCPSCHRAIHMYYKKWLNEHGKNDFSTKQEAHDVFLRAFWEIS